MKTVYYYHDFSERPEQIGKEEGMKENNEGPKSAELLGIIRYNGDGQDYLITRTTQAFNDDPNYIGKLTARRVISYDSFDNVVILIDGTEDENTRKIENQFEAYEYPERTIKSIINHAYDSTIEKDILKVTAINKDCFEKKIMLIGTKPFVGEEIKAKI